MHVSKDQVDVKLEIPGAAIRQRTDFGQMAGSDTISAECFTLGGRRTTFQGLEGDLCVSPLGLCRPWAAHNRRRAPSTAAHNVRAFADARLQPALAVQLKVAQDNYEVVDCIPVPVAQRCRGDRRNML